MDSKTRLKLIRLVDINKKILNLKSPKLHLDILDLLNQNNKYTLISASRGFAKTTLTSCVYLPTFTLETKKDEYIIIYSQNTQKALSFLNDTKEALRLFIDAGFNLIKLNWTSNAIKLSNEYGSKITIKSKSITQDTRGEKEDFLRPTLVLCDDIESKSISSKFNVKTTTGRAKVKDFFYSDLLPSLNEDGRVIFIGTILHHDSLLANLIKDPVWKKIIIPVCENNKSNWPSKYPLTKEDAKALNTLDSGEVITSIEEIKQNWFIQGKHTEFYQEYMCKAIADEKKLFNPNDFKYFQGLEYNEPKIQKINNSIEEKSLFIKSPKSVKINNENIPIEHFNIKAAMDLASDGLDESVIIVGGLYKSNFYLFESIGGHFNPFLKVAKVLEVLKSYKINAFGVEKAGAQNDFFYTLKVAQEQYNTFIPLVPLSHGGKAKNIRIAYLEPYFKTSRIFFNQKDANLANLEAELLDFDIDSDSKKDNYIDALAYLISMFFGIGREQTQSLKTPKLVRGYERFY